MSEKSDQKKQLLLMNIDTFILPFLVDTALFAYFSPYQHV